MAFTNMFIKEFVNGLCKNVAFVRGKYTPSYKKGIKQNQNKPMETTTGLQPVSRPVEESSLITVRAMVQKSERGL